jgi:hypothetical protein
VARVRTRPLLVWAFVLAVCGCWFWGWTENKDYWLEPQVGALTCFVLAVVLKFWLAAEACRQIVEQRTAGTLEVLLSTPMKIEEILRGQLGGLQRQFAAPALFTLGLCALFYFGGLKQVEIPRDATEWTWLWVSGAVVFGADLVALYFVGMWEALRVLNPQRAASNAVARVLVLPWVAFAGIMLGLSILSMNSEVSFPSYSPIALWLVLSLVTDFAFGIWARGRLLHRFRQTAGERHSGGKGRAENSLTSAKP